MASSTLDDRCAAVEAQPTDHRAALKRYVRRHTIRLPPVSVRRLKFEQKRPRIVQECVAEGIGTFIYVFSGLISVAALTLNLTSPIVSIFSSLQQIGVAFAMGIVLAINVCGSVTGAHFNPGLTLCFAIYKGFPWRKVPAYIISQILGALVAGLVVVGCFWPQMQAAKTANIKACGTAVYQGSVASILCPFPPVDFSHGHLVMQEGFASGLLGFVIAACGDPTNPLQTATTIPWTIGMGYAVMVWGFGALALSMNTARDLGTRLVAAIFFGSEAFTYQSFCWVPLLVNIPSYIFGMGLHEFGFRESLRCVDGRYIEHVDGERGLCDYLTSIGVVEPAATDSDDSRRSDGVRKNGFTQHVDRVG